ncbi:DUF6114 domain-containing protein [Streptomyces sp. CA-278952]|uniref:DUF6114 domain-containing protein n=1 Tax=unclassified Streptomyces TaxID=2593676 RepID=UPI0022425067|nr:MULTISPECIES: DUF6114 domain-containing protein [unclassified Streptomyces]UZI28662.1 DUF6114 domain-containing protein [Streptomyces sp. VB1]WDG28601.1 DUF6114 domain-containing protein [Streptomyces sp. CA-278952]
MSPESTGQNEHYIRVVRRRFRAWRGHRPFWAGLFTMAGGIPIAYFPYASMTLGNMTLAMSTTAGAGSLIIGVLLITLGLTMWYHSIVRVFAGVAAILLALISIPVANIGGFVIGFALALVGGAMSISWAPGKPEDAEGTPLAEHRDVERSAGESHATAATVPQQQGAGYELAVDGDGGRNRAG